MFLLSWPGGSWEATATYAGLMIGLYIATFWLALVFWTARDIRQRSSSQSVQMTSTLLVLCFFVPGLFIYLMMRPRYTRSQRYAMQLEEEALRLDLDRDIACPECSRPVREEFLVCPACKAQLKTACTKCSRPMSNAWVACAYCGTERKREPAKPAAVAGRVLPTLEPTRLPVPATPTAVATIADSPGPKVAPPQPETPVPAAQEVPVGATGQ